MSIEVAIEKDFGSFRLNVSFSGGNEVLAILGGSGCGKSMTLRCIAGIVRPDRGRIAVDGVTFFDSERNINLPPQQRRVGLLFQNYALFHNMTVEENIAAGVREKLSQKEKLALARQSISKFRLDGLEDHLPRALSGGQQQRVALARILIGQPRILMLDEPFSALDSYLRWERNAAHISRHHAAGVSQPRRSIPPRPARVLTGAWYVRAGPNGAGSV